MKHKNRMQLGNWIFLLGIVLIAIMGFLDSVQIGSWHDVDDQDKWQKYNSGNQQAFIILWFLIFIVIGIVWYGFTKDISEALAFVLSGSIMLATGLLDVFFFILSPYKMSSNMCWFNDYNSIIGKFSETFSSHTCVTAFDLWFFAILGVALAFGIFKLLMYFKPNRSTNK